MSGIIDPNMFYLYVFLICQLSLIADILQLVCPDATLLMCPNYAQSIYE